MRGHGHRNDARRLPGADGYLGRDARDFPQVVGPVSGSHRLEKGWVGPPRDFLEADRPISGPYYLRKVKV